MRICLLSTLLCLVQLSHSEVLHSNYADAFEHLKTINTQWNLHRDIVSSEKIAFQTDASRISYHLLLVTEHLRKNAPYQLTSQQLKKRNTLLDSLYIYARTKQFPVNTGHSARTPYFIDQYGTYCAVGYLIQASGHKSLATNISGQHNYDYIENIHTPGLTEWSNEHGFDIDELKWIQPSYGIEFTTSAFGAGVNGEVRVLRRFDTQNGSRLLIAGEFSKLDSADCKGIGFYENGDFTCIGEGMHGEVNDLYYQHDTTWAFGDFRIDEKNYSIAYHHEGRWNGFSMPHNAFSIAKTFEKTSVSHCVALNSVDSQQAQVWDIKNRKKPHLVFELNGSVNDIEITPYGTALVGGFDSVLHVDSLKHSRSQFLFFFQQNPELFRTIDSLDVIRLNKIAYLNKKVYLMGTNNFRNFFSNRQQCLHVYEPDTILAVKNSMEFFGSVYDMEFYQDRIYFGGDFNLSWGTGDSRSLGSLTGTANSVDFGGYIGGTVNAVEYLLDEDIMVIGGRFAGWDGFGKRITHLVMRDNNPSSIAKAKPTSLAFFPNPAMDKVNLTLDGAEMVTIWDIQYRKVLQRGLHGTETNSIALNELENGVYVAEVLTESGDKLIEKLVVHR